MATAKTKAPDLSGPFYRALHSLLRHGTDEAETRRAVAVWQWLKQRPHLKHACNDVQKDILIAIWKLAGQNETLPTYDAVYNEVCGLPKNTEIIDALKNDYLAAADSFKAFDAQDLPSVVADWTDNYNKLALRSLLTKTNQIALGAEEIDRETWSGKDDAVKFLMTHLQTGIFYEDAVTADLRMFSTEQEQVLMAGIDGTESYSILGLDASQVKPEVLTWIWEGRIPDGKMTLITGKPDNGKSLGTIDIVARVTTGADWPDGAKNTQGPKKVLMACAEDDINDTVVPRLMAAGADLSKIRFITNVKVQDYASEENAGPEVRDLQLAADTGKLRQILESDSEIALVVVDTVTSYFGDVNANADKEIRPVMDALAKAFRDTQACLIAVIHHNKRSDADAVQKILGASSVAGSVRAAWGFSRDPDNKEEFYMSHVKGNLSKDKGGMKFKIASKTIVIAGTETSQPYIEWLGKTDETADEVSAKEQDSKESRRENRASTMAQAFLTMALEKGPRKAVELFEEAEKEGISGYQLKAASRKMDVTKYQKEHQWLWSKNNPGAEAMMPDIEEVVV